VIHRQPQNVVAVPVSGRGSVSAQRKAACVGGSRERARPATRGVHSPRPTLSASRVPPTKSLTPPATSQPRAGPSGGPNFPTC